MRNLWFRVGLRPPAAISDNAAQTFEQHPVRAVLGDFPVCVMLTGAIRAFVAERQQSAEIILRNEAEPHRLADIDTVPATFLFGQKISGRYTLTHAAFADRYHIAHCEPSATLPGNSRAMGKQDAMIWVKVRQGIEHGRTRS
jgi:hypothetical protein